MVKKEIVEETLITNGKFDKGERAFLYIPDEAKVLQEQFKSESQTNPVQFPKELGEKHPFEFKDCEDTCKKYGLVKAAVDKHLDFIFSHGFKVKTDDTNADALLDSLLKEKEFFQSIRTWAHEGFVKGNGFMEIAVAKDTVQLKVVNANHMFVIRNKKGEVEGYNQYVADLNKFKIADLNNTKKTINFNKDEIAHLKINEVADEAYGYGIIYPALHTVNNLVRSEKDLHLLMSRKANNPIIVTVGSIEQPASNSDVSSIGAQLVYLNNLHEWAFNHQVKFEMLDFGDIGGKFDTILAHDKQKLYMELQVPAVLMGDSQQNEGIANVQLDTFERRIQSLQERIADVIEEQIFEPFLEMNGFKLEPEIEWGQPSEESINERIMKLTSLLQNSMLSPELRAMIEKDIALNLGYDDDVDKLPNPDEANDLDLERQTQRQQVAAGVETQVTKKEDKERKKEEGLKQPEVPGAKKTKEHLHESFDDLTVREYVSSPLLVQEIAGFNFKEYIDAVLNRIKSDDFTDLLAKTKEDIKNGLLSEKQIVKLKNILENAFTKNLTIRQIEENISKGLRLRDRVDDGLIILTAEVRPNIIARTETVRLSNDGLIDMYKTNGIERVRFLASISNRTCEQCSSLNGQIYNINESMNFIPNNTHPNCRCTWVSLRE